MTKALSLGVAVLLVGMLTVLHAKGPQVELISDHDPIKPGQTFTVALKLDMDPLWHTYWINPGDTGYAVTVNWTLPDGVRVGQAKWPAPVQFKLDEFVNIGYKEQLLLLQSVSISDSYSSDTLSLKATVSWLECKDVCIPKSETVAMTVPIRPDSQVDVSKISFFDAAQKALIRTHAVDVVAEKQGNRLRLSWPKAQFYPSQDVSFYSETQGLFNLAKGQQISESDTRQALGLWLHDDVGDVLPKVLRGIFTYSDNDGRLAGLQVSFPISVRAGPPTDVLEMQRLVLMLAFAFLGGLILNLMPCVFPVISLKVFHIIQFAEEGRSRAWRHGLVFSGGVILSFLFLASLLLFLRSQGHAIGWGFQLQSPIFVSVMAILFFLIALNLLGVFEVGASLTRFSDTGRRTDGYFGSFNSGVFATMVATPCVAPFMGVAIGVALGQAWWVAIAIFVMLGIGMSFPYVVLTLWPAVMSRLPKPGAWMLTFKQILAFPMMATVIWLCWVLGRQVGVDGPILLLTTMLILGLAAWVLGKWTVPPTAPRRRLWAWVVVLMLSFLAGLYLLESLDRLKARSAMPSTAEDVESDRWMTFTPERLSHYRAQGKPVFIDFTAAWCLTCQVNKKITFSDKSVLAKFEALGVILMRADWTNRDPDISNILRQYGRSGVPFYLLFPDGVSSEPYLLPELLTPAILLDWLDKLDR